MTKKQLDAGIDGLRAATRPIIIYALLFGSFFFISEGVVGEYVDLWIKLTMLATGEWVLERPVGKIINGLRK